MITITVCSTKAFNFVAAVYEARNKMEETYYDSNLDLVEDYLFNNEKNRDAIRMKYLADIEYIKNELNSRLSKLVECRFAIELCIDDSLGNLRIKL